MDHILSNGGISSIRVAYSNLPPFVHIKEENGHQIFDGFMPAIFRAVTQWMKLNVTWIREPNDTYGSWNGTTFSGMVGMLHRNEVDVIMNPLIPNLYVYEIADFTNPIIYEAFTMLSGKETHEGGLFLYFSVLEPMVWSGIGISLIATSCASAMVFQRLSKEVKSSILVVLEYIWLCVAYMLQQVPSEKWLLLHKKSRISILMVLLIMIWVIGVAFLVMNVFQSLLVSKLTIVKHYPVVDTMEDFLRKKHVIGLTPREIELQLALKGFGNPLYERTWEKLEPELVDAKSVFSDESFENVEKGKTCLFHGHLIFRSVLSEYFKKKGRCNFHLSENYFYPFPLVVAMKRTMPRKFKDKLNAGITRLLAADISGKWFKTIFEICYLCTSYSETDLKPLNISNIFGVLLIWGVGMLSATISVIIENVYFNSQHRTRHRKKRRVKER